MYHKNIHTAIWMLKNEVKYKQYESGVRCDNLAGIDGFWNALCVGYSFETN